MLFILDSHQRVIGTLDNDTPKGLPYFNDMLEESLESGMVVYEFETLGDHPDSRLLEPEGCILKKKPEGGDFYLFKIKEVSKSSADGKNILRVLMETIATSELLSAVVRPTTFFGRNVDFMMGEVLSGTDWSVGVVENTLEIRDVEIERHMTTLAAIYEVASRFNVEIEFAARLGDGNQVTKHVHLRTKRGNQSAGVRFEYEQNLQGVTREVSSNQVVTGLVGVGQADENGDFLGIHHLPPESMVSELLDDPDIELVGDALVSRSAFENFGVNGRHILGIFEDNDATNARELLQNTYRELKRLMEPRVTYTTSVATLKQLAGYGHHNVRLGDAVVVSDVTFNPPLFLKARVVSMKTSETEPEKSELLLGDYVRLLHRVDSGIDRIGHLIREKEASWNEGRNLAQEALDRAGDAHGRIDEIGDDRTNIQVGGRNLIRNSDFSEIDIETEEISHWEVFGDDVAASVDQVSNRSVLRLVSDEDGGTRQQLNDLEVGPDYTLSFMAASMTNNSDEGEEEASAGTMLNVKFVPRSVGLDEEINSDENELSLADLDESNSDEDEGETPADLDESDSDDDEDEAPPADLDEEIILTFELNEDLRRFEITFPTENLQFFEHPELIVSGDDVLITALQLERGNVATNHRPAPEDSLEAMRVLGELVQDARWRLEPDNITSTVMQSTVFEQRLDGLASADSLNDAIGEQSEMMSQIEQDFERRFGETQVSNQLVHQEVSQMRQEFNHVTTSFTKAGGVNILQNSIGLSGLDYWTATGDVSTARRTAVSEADRSSEFRFLSGTSSLRQTVTLTRGDTYTLSWRVLKDIPGTFTVRIIEQEVVTGGNKSYVIDDTDSNFRRGKLTFTPVFSEVIIEFESSFENARHEHIALTSIMLNLGSEAFLWTSHPMEIHSANVRMDMNGIRVDNSDQNGYTVMNPREFAGYYQKSPKNSERVFGINKDEFTMNKANVTKQIKMGPVKIVPLQNATRKGWAFVPNTD